MKIFGILMMVVMFTFAHGVAYAGGCSGGYHTHSSDSSDKKKKGTGI